MDGDHIVKHSDAKFLGISMSEHNLVLAEIGPPSERIDIRQLASLRMEEPFDFRTMNKDNAITKVSETIESALHMRNIQASRAALSIPDRMALVKVFPIDANMNDLEKNEHLQWEVEQFLLSDEQEYIKDFQNLPFVTGLQNQMMLVAVRKMIVEFIKDVFAKTSLKLTNVDLDMFSAIRAVEANYDFRPESKAVLVQFDEFFFKVVQIQEGKFLGFEEFSYNKGENNSETKSVSLLAEEVFKKIDQMISYYFDECDQSDLDRILLFGRYIPTGLIDELQELCPAPVDTVNPFNKIRLSAQAEQSRGTHDFHDFLIAVGTALRGVRS